MTTLALASVTAAAALAPRACGRARGDGPRDRAGAGASLGAEPASPAPAPAAEPVHVEELDVPDDLAAYVVRGGADRDDPGDELHMVFLPGMCVHPMGYVQAFQRAAAARGELVALQGDVSCGGDGDARRWSNDLGAMAGRIDAALSTAGVPTDDVVLIGYSQGAERAERLIARAPEKFTRAVLMASPIVPSPRRLGRARAVVLMAGTHDMALGPMRGAVPRLERAGVPATFIELPGAHHGSMGEDPEETMAEALDFLDEHAKPAPP
jgi:pimeloyl-ACP methyl ester carboxylesterase